MVTNILRLVLSLGCSSCFDNVQNNEKQIINDTSIMFTNANINIINVFFF